MQFRDFFFELSDNLYLLLFQCFVIGIYIETADFILDYTQYGVGRFSRIFSK